MYNLIIIKHHDISEAQLTKLFVKSGEEIFHEMEIFSNNMAHGRLEFPAMCSTCHQGSWVLWIADLILWIYIQQLNITDTQLQMRMHQGVEDTLMHQAQVVE